MKGIVEKISMYPEKGASGIELAEAQLIAGLGVEGDFYSKGGDRQVSILLAESRERMTAMEEEGLCFSRFRENLTIGYETQIHHTKARRHEGRNLVFMPGDCLNIGETVLEISSDRKRCFEECDLFKAGKFCPLAGMYLFAKVIKGGIIHRGDTVLYNAAA